VNRPYDYECKSTKLLVVEVEVGHMRRDLVQEHLNKVAQQFDERYPEIKNPKIFVPMVEGKPTINIREVDLGITGVERVTPAKND
jgi:hypothetical protein